MSDTSEDRAELVLTRRPGESVWLETRNGLIKITQLARWRMAIQAPRDVVVSREEARSNPDAG